MYRVNLPRHHISRPRAPVLITKRTIQSPMNRVQSFHSGVAETYRSSFALPGALRKFNRLAFWTCCGWSCGHSRAP